MQIVETLGTKKEIETVQRIISLNSGSDMVTLEKILLRIFQHEISPRHYVILGLLIGQRFAAREMQNTIINFTKVCQRQN